MPMYSYTNFESGETIDKFFKMSEKPNHVFENGVQYDYVVSSPMIVSGVNPYKGVPSDFKDHLSSIKKKVPEMRSNLV